MFTYLSYYYSGLTNEQLDSTLKILETDNNRIEEYNTWIKYLPNKYKIDDSIKNYGSLNLSDTFQKRYLLYPVLKKHPLVINYWANEVLFANEAIGFDEKLGK